MKAKIKTSFNYIMAIILIIFGIVGWVLPVMPGLVFIFAGVIILCIENPKLDDYVLKKFFNHPKFETVFLKVRGKVRGFLG